MGAACCCLGDDYEDMSSNSNSSSYGNFICIPFILQNFLHVYTSLFRRAGQVHALPSSTQGTASLNSTQSQDEYLASMYRPPPRPLPYDADPRLFGLQRDGLVSRREKGSSHSHEETEPLRTIKVDYETESVSTKSKGVMFTCGEDVGKGYRKSSSTLSTVDATGYAHIHAPSSEDEDVCPTCLEEYDVENPKIFTKCSHHFHLGCIYEWMERSDRCPVCGKVMVFDETT